MLPLPPCRSLVPSLCETIRTSYAIGAYSRLLMYSPSCTSARPARSPATDALPRPPASVTVASCERTGASTGRHNTQTDEPALLTCTCTGARYLAVQDARWLWAHKRRSTLGGAPRIPTVTAPSGGRRLRVWKRHGSILEAFYTSSRDPSPYLCPPTMVLAAP